MPKKMFNIKIYEGGIKNMVNKILKAIRSILCELAMKIAERFSIA